MENLYSKITHNAFGSIGYAGSLKLFYIKSVNEFYVSAEKLGF